MDLRDEQRVMLAPLIPRPKVRADGPWPPAAEIERLRTTWITRGPTTWPVKLKKLPGSFGDCVRAVRRLDPELRSACNRARHLLESCS